MENFEKIWTNHDKYFEEIFMNFVIMWKKKREGLYKFLMKLLSKSCEKFRKMLRKFKKTLCYSLIPICKPVNKCQSVSDRLWQIMQFCFLKLKDCPIWQTVLYCRRTLLCDWLNCWHFMPNRQKFHALSLAISVDQDVERKICCHSWLKKKSDSAPAKYAKTGLKGM